MKKIFLLCAVLLAAVSFVSREDNTDPKAKQPVNKDFLNTPPLANQTYVLETAGSVQLTCSQPDYDVATPPTYAVQVSLDPEFSKVISDSKYLYSAEDALPYSEVAYTTTHTTLDVPARDIADGISACLGYTDISQYAGREAYSGPVYVRVRSFFPSLTGDLANLYSIESNVVTLPNVISYPSVRQPGWIYLVGAPNGWNEPSESNAAIYEDWMLYEPDNGIGTQIYVGTFFIPDGQFTMRFYKELTGWDADSYGSQKDDNAVDIEFDGGKYSGKIGGPGYKGSYNVPGWTANWVKFTVNLKAGSVDFEIVDPVE